MMTEEDAKTKWCFAAGQNRREIRLGEQCIASQCMAWRWQPTHINNPEGGDMIWSARAYGYCGLAGESKPLPVSAPQ